MSKKLNSALFSTFLLLFSIGRANTVPFDRVQLVAKNFLQQTSGNPEITLSLIYTAYSNNGVPLYYAFSTNNNSGFILVAAEDAAYPVIGYSTKENFVVPDPNSNIGAWLKTREREIDHLRINNIAPDSKITQTWLRYINNTAPLKERSASTSTVAPLLTTLWNQSPFYNDSCPGGSVTGCVATTMAQIMKYWNYPLHGTGNSSYCDCYSQSYSNDYGTLTAHYGNATYNYASMPNSLSSANPEVAKLMYHCGVSVQMDYSPSGSGAVVINADSPISAENSFISYFGYNPSTILGVHRSDYTDPNWHTLLKNDLNIGRPIQYAGFGSFGGHTWVCDGYDQNNFYHMNWGWGGSSNGYFNIDMLNPSGMDFSYGQEALTGIVPIATNAIDAGILNITPSDILCSTNNVIPVIKFRNYGINNLTSCNINYKIDNQNYQTINWTGLLVTGQTATIALTSNVLSNGSHTFVCNTSNPNNNSDGNIMNDQSISSLNLITPNALPLIDGFEDQNTLNNWAVVPSNSSDWTINTQSFSGGIKSMMIDNLNNTPGNTSILQGLSDYNLSTYASVQFSFKVAYQQKTATSNDKLALQVSDDCGETWKTRWTKQGADLATTTITGSTPYLPSPNDYVSHNVVMPFYNSAIFRWVFTSDANDPGNNLFIDEINLIDPTVGLKEINLDLGLTVYPNPAKDQFTIEYNSKESHSLSIEVLDLLGKVVAHFSKGTIEAGDNEFVIETAQFKNGVYFLNINIDSTKVVKKIVVQN